jgi:prepilin-type N-terminal cleavage/methylation domain-containing protein
LIKGFTFLELLIAVGVFAIGLLGIASFAIANLQRIQESYWRSVAVSEVNSIFELTNSAHRDCTSWQGEIHKLLPNANLKCSVTQISLCWRGKFSKKNCFVIS